MQLVMPFAKSASYAPEDFIRGHANDEALTLIERWPDWTYSVVLVHGPQGSGKTHAAHVFCGRAQARMLAPERVGELPADALLAGAHAWVLDDVEKVGSEAGLAQLINHARARGDYLLLTAQTSARALPFGLPDLRSRLQALPTIAIGAPDDALLMGVLSKLFSDRQLRIPPEVLRYAITRLERSFSAMQRFVTQVDEAALARGRAVTLPLVREVLGTPDDDLRWQQG